MHEGKGFSHCFTLSEDSLTGSANKGDGKFKNQEKKRTFRFAWCDSRSLSGWPFASVSVAQRTVQNVFSWQHNFPETYWHRWLLHLPRMVSCVTVLKSSS